MRIARHMTWVESCWPAPKEELAYAASPGHFLLRCGVQVIEGVFEDSPPFKQV